MAREKAQEQPKESPPYHSQKQDSYSQKKAAETLPEKSEVVKTRGNAGSYHRPHGHGSHQ